MPETGAAGHIRTAITYREALLLAADAIAPLPDASPGLEAQLLLAFALDRPRTHLLAWPERSLTAAQQACFLELLQRRRGGEPLAYITGRREFWSLDLAVTPDTLIPRPETETLVEWALERLPETEPASLADLGTGSGAVAAAIARDRPQLAVIATDISPAALEVARGNFRRLGLDRVETRAGDWVSVLEDDRQFDLIVSNPPYVAEGDPHLARGDLPWEPPLALASGMDGLRDIRRIIRQAPGHLAADGWLLLEHGNDQGAAVRALLHQAGYRRIATRRDLEGRERVSGGMRAET